MQTATIDSKPMRAPRPAGCKARPKAGSRQKRRRPAASRSLSSVQTMAYATGQRVGLALLRLFNRPFCHLVGKTLGSALASHCAGLLVAVLV